MADPRKYTRQTVSGYYDPELKTNGVQVTAWTDDAWNRAQEANRRYQADQEWQRAHPYLAGMRNFGRGVLNGVGNFINDEVLLNKGNIRVKNAQANPEVMDAIQSGGNIAGGMIALPFAIGAAAETAPAWGPYAMRGLRALATPKGMLAADATLTAGFTANQWMPWLLGSAGAVATIPAGQYIAENGVPSISLPQFGSRSMTAAAAPTDSVGTTPANPPAAPADTTGTVAPGTTAPAPRPEGNDSTSQRRPSFRERLGDRIAGRSNGQTTSSGTTPSPNNNQNGSFLGRMLWETKNNNFGQNWWQWRNVGRVGLGLSYPAREHLWPAVGQGVKYMTVGPDSIPAATTPPVAPAAPAQTPVDSSYVAKDQYIAPTDTLDF